MNEKDLNLPAYYEHKNGDLEPLFINGYDGKGRAWVTWKKDGFKNMVLESSLIFLSVNKDI